ncbi:hypothetical protein AGRA3207_004478 [Actinomadura graeca]|uniref:Uncharacterized protein n=1 Tax=Actinomadura graeca TaxID=2750812 RepID=A0ABX8R0V3_9ACTN|nr:hypothetical protein [Actinomadura graeca]QXJ23337.1 hypothetical protein AGRA3207_004478 [Actinomadura graeca]
MATTPRRTPAHQLMINCLHGAHIAHGRPSSAKILDIVRRLPELYPDLRAERDTDRDTGLSSAGNIYKIIMGWHGCLPTAPQLSRLILAFQHFAFVERVIHDDPGTATLPGWQAVLSEATVLDIAQRNSGVFIDATRPDPSQPVRLPAPGPASAGGLPQTRTPVGVVALSPVEVHCLVTLGPHGRKVTVRASSGDPGTLYEMALGLFTSGSPYNERAATFAASAAAAGVAAATDLLIASESGAAAMTQLVLGQVRALEYAAVRGNDEDAARYFSECAARVVRVGVKEQAPQLDG